MHQSFACMTRACPRLTWKVNHSLTMNSCCTLDSTFFSMITCRAAVPTRPLRKATLDVIPDLSRVYPKELVGRDGMEGTFAPLSPLHEGRPRALE
jgi:hypothetical protein